MKSLPPKYLFDGAVSLKFWFYLYIRFASNEAPLVRALMLTTSGSGLCLIEAERL